MKKGLKLISLFVIPMLLSGCGTSFDPSGNSNDSSPTEKTEIEKIYDLYKANGGTQTYEEWLASIKGEKGDKGDKGEKGDKGNPGSSLMDDQGILFYPLNDGTLAAEGRYSLYLDEINIPATFGGKTVSTIVDFGQCQAERIVLPNTIKEIMTYGFFNCPNLRYINIPEGVTSFDVNAFGSCRSLEEISIPSTLTSIEDYSFYQSLSITTINYGGTKEQWENMTNNRFFYNEEIKVTCSDGVYAYENDKVYFHKSGTNDPFHIDDNKYFAYVWDGTDNPDSDLKAFIELTFATNNNRRAFFDLPDYAAKFIILECQKETTTPDWDYYGDYPGTIFYKTPDIEIDSNIHCYINDTSQAHHPLG